MADTTGQHTGMKTHGSRLIGESMRLNSEELPLCKAPPPTTLDVIYSVRTANADMIHQIGDRLSSIINRLDGAKTKCCGESDQSFVSNGRLNDLRDDLSADGSRLAEILADLDQLEALL